MQFTPAVLVLGFFGLATAFANDIPVAPITPGGYAPWTATGHAFDKGPAHGPMIAQQDITNAATDSVISSEVDGDAPTGTLTSPPFKIERRFLAFRIGGGDNEHVTALELVVDGKVVRSATGWQSDRLAPASWDVADMIGATAQVRVVDQASGDWGHLNVDRLVQTDTPERQPIDVGPLYSESLRPQFHFTARQWTVRRLNPVERQEGWLNDLNGLTYYDGEYHLFAQRWAKCWLHAVSTDLVHWKELPPAFWEESDGSGVQSGSIVVDYANTSKLSPDAKTPPMVAFWSRWNNREQCISFSLDHGRTWQPYAKNPILAVAERDPKVFWYEPARHWVMMLYGDGQYHILTSPDLLNWTDTHHPIKNSFECPDFFELPIAERPGEKKWVLIQGNGNYSVGTFDGKQFTEQTDRRACDPGDFYATQTWGNTETGDNRRIQAAWTRFSNFPDMPFSQQVTFPCELSLHDLPGVGLRIFRTPVREIATLHDSGDEWKNLTLSPGRSVPLAPAGRFFHIKADVAIPKGSKITFNVRGVPVVLTGDSVQCEGRSASAARPITSVEMLVDAASIEMFANGGELSLTKFVLPRASGLSVQVEGGPADIRSLSVHTLRSAWTKQPVPDGAKREEPAPNR